ncbi:MAG: S8 family serine peptidase [Candidatus Eremiobacteraeota bacterium]|nr:S8 family serine peptidase [Candidatus Eremiobacteraeota bacterium]
MIRFWLAAVAAGLLTAACAGHAGGPGTLPTVAQPQVKTAHPAVNLFTMDRLTADPAPAGWSATATRALAAPPATHANAVTGTRPMTVRLGLQLRNVQGLIAAIRAHQIMTPAEFARAYGPSPERVNAVEAYLHGQGFRRIEASPNGLIVSASGSRANVERAFNTRIVDVASQGRSYYANSTPAYVPKSLGGTVVAVMGLNDQPTVQTGPKRVTKASATPTPSPVAQPCTQNVEGLCPRFYDPPSFQLAYDAASAPTASNTNIAIMTEGDLTQAISDFRQNEKVFGLKPANIVQVQAEPPSSDTAGATEWTLDMTYSTGIAAVVKNLFLYNFATLNDSDIVVGYNKWVTDDRAPIANSSFGGCEVFPYTDGSMLVGDEVLVEAAAQGQTMFVSSGDNGGYCNNFVDTNGAPGGAPMVEWPAASPYVVAVGGTDLFSNPDGTYLGEFAWEAGGGGLSQFEYSPSWESGVQPVGTTPAGYSFRGVPDVAMDAALETGALLYTSTPAVNGTCTPCTTGGTSLASPLAAGSYARMQSAHRNALGFGAIAFYNIYNANPSPEETSAGPPPWQLVGGFHDILSGSNGLYTALQRYDYTTGLGSFDVSKTNAIIQ